MSAVLSYRKKPVVIQAMQLPEANHLVEDFHRWCDAVGFSNWASATNGIEVQTLEGVMHAAPGDWIIKGVKGEFYPCKPDIFALTYEPEQFTRPRGVVQEWLHSLPMMQQTVLFTAIRGPDGLPKYGCVKMLLRWYRRCVLLSAMDGKVIDAPHHRGGGSFTGPSFPAGEMASTGWEANMDEIVSEYLRKLDAVPHHFQMHLMHAVEILGYKHPLLHIRSWWHNVYLRLVHDMHLNAETEEQMDGRLGDNREGWLKRADPATVE